jgi:hypothetical protein
MSEQTPNKTAAIYQGFREYWDAAPDSIAKQNALMILRAWQTERKCIEELERENLGLLDAAVKSAERIEELGRAQETLHGQIDGETKALLARIEKLKQKAAAYKEAYLSERAYHANNTGENAARRKKAVVALREADDG